MSTVSLQTGCLRGAHGRCAEQHVHGISDVAPRCLRSRRIAHVGGPGRAHLQGSQLRVLQRLLVSVRPAVSSRQGH
jgi:hypothetical protein